MIGPGPLSSQFVSGIKVLQFNLSIETPNDVTGAKTAVDKPFQTPRGQLNTIENSSMEEDHGGFARSFCRLMVIGAYTTQSSNILGLSSFILLFPIHQQLQSNGRGV